MSQQKPKKPKQTKLNPNNKKTLWRKILKDVEKNEVPIHVLESLTVHLKDGSKVVVNIKQLLSEGADPDEIEQQVNSRLQELEKYIDNVDFFVDLNLVEATVQPVTDKLLSNL
jgi:hypothetical protein